MAVAEYYDFTLVPLIFEISVGRQKREGLTQLLLDEGAHLSDRGD